MNFLLNMNIRREMIKSFIFPLTKSCQSVY